MTDAPTPPTADFEDPGADLPSVQMPRPDIEEFAAHHRSGWLMFGAGLALVPFAALVLVAGLLTAGAGYVAGPVLAGLSLIAAVLAFAGLTAVSPGEARVLQLLGRYDGTIRTEGLRWVNPLTRRRKVSTRIRNHETGVAKVNDADGNPIEIAAVVVWRVVDTAQARFSVDDFVDFVGMQAETAVRHIANTYPYDVHDESHVLSLRDNAEEITERLSAEVGARVAPAGVAIIESRITHLAYAPEIASAMLRRQQAGAVVAARQRIVEGAVGMVELALDRLASHDVVELDEERKAQMVSNLLVVLCGERDAHPVVNAGSLY